MISLKLVLESWRQVCVDDSLSELFILDVLFLAQLLQESKLMASDDADGPEFLVNNKQRAKTKTPEHLIRSLCACMLLPLLSKSLLTISPRS